MIANVHMIAKVLHVVSVSTILLCVIRQLILQIGGLSLAVSNLFYISIYSTRGLVMDIEQGNFLKLAQDGTVLRYKHSSVASLSICDVICTTIHFLKLLDN
jgi:hypothetical protein